MINIMGPPLPWSEPENKSLDLMAARYFFLPQNRNVTDNRGVGWIDQNAEFWLGSGCNELPRRSASLNLPTPVKSTALAIVSRLACSVQIQDGAEIARLRLTDAQGKVETQSLLAGRDASGWAYDCGGRTANMPDRGGKNFSSYESRIHDAPFAGHYYVTTVELDGVQEIESEAVEWG